MSRRACTIALFALLTIPAGLTAQACIGIPQGTRSAVLGSVGLAEDLTSLGLSATTAVVPNLYLSGTAQITTFDFEGSENETELGVSGAYQIPQLVETMSICPRAGVSYAFFDGGSGFGIPIGVGAGKTIPLDFATGTVTPFLIPEWTWVSSSVDGVDDRFNDSFFSLSGGGTAAFGRFLVGASLSKVLEEDRDVVVGIHAGLTI